MTRPHLGVNTPADLSDDERLVTSCVSNLIEISASYVRDGRIS
jgi:hypothetical protein